MNPSPELLFRPELLAQGYTDAEILRMRRSGALGTVRGGGAYVAADDERLNRAEDRHALLVDSTFRRLAPASAALPPPVSLPAAAGAASRRRRCRLPPVGAATVRRYRTCPPGAARTRPGRGVARVL